MAESTVHKQNGVKAVLENLIVVAIILVLVQTFMEDFARIADWTWSRRKILVFAGFGFDLLFTVEFFARFFSAAFDRRAGEYFFRRRGWIDLLASVPLLLFNSGPEAAAVILGGTAAVGLSGVLNALKVVKAVRIARVLRLLRVLKIFKQIKYADSTMAQRHITRITTLTVTCVVFVLFAYSAAAPFTGIPAADEKYGDVYESTAAAVAENLEKDREKTALAVAETERDLLIIKEEGETIYTRYQNEYYREFFGPADYRYIPKGEYGFFYDLRPASKQQARDNLLFFGIIIILVAVYLILYSPHFALTVTDPIHVIRKGLADPGYNLEVKIPPKYREDDVFQLASVYNAEYLPWKDRIRREEGGNLGDLSLDDFGDLFGPDRK